MGGQPEYRALILGQLDEITALHPDRYKRFVRSGSAEHTALRTPTFYLQQIDGARLRDWTDAFIDDDPAWVDIVQDFVPLP